jgi:hypothetical protein
VRWLDIALDRAALGPKPALFFFPFLVLITLILTGCTSPSARSSVPTPPAPSKDRIAQLNVITVPVALDLDGKPGADGIAVKLYANNARDPKAIRIREGTVEFVMFDGTFHGRTNPPPILHSVTFTAPELRLHEFNSRIGWGYDFSLRWGTNLPTQRIMSVGARYTAPNAGPIVSRPSSVTVLNK